MEPWGCIDADTVCIFGLLAKLTNITYHIRVKAAPGFYFSKWVFGWGSIQKIPQKVDFLTKKWGLIQEKLK